MERRARRFWADFFGLDPDDLDRPGVRVVAHQGLGNYSGAWIFWRAQAIIVSTPPDRTDGVRAAVAELGSSIAPEELVPFLGAYPERLIGPAYQGYLAAPSFRPWPEDRVTQLRESDELIEALGSACEAEEWSQAGIDPARPEPCFGYLQENRLVALAQNAFWAEDVVSPGLIVHPEHRSRGYGKAVLSAVVSDALAQGHLVLYQTLKTNVPAVRAAETLGFYPFASHLAVRFRS